jgi:hypothetical protein
MVDRKNELLLFSLFYPYIVNCISGTVPLESLHISGQMDIGAPYVTVLVSVFARSVRNMMIMESDLNAKQTLDMWQLVGDCKQLHRFTFLAGEPDEDRSDTDTVIGALQGKELRTVGVLFYSFSSFRNCCL